MNVTFMHGLTTYRGLGAFRMHRKTAAETNSLKADLTLHK